MGHKTHPVGFRIGTQFQWLSKWFADKNYTEFLLADLKIRKFLTKKLQKAGLDRVEIERSLKKIKVNVYVSKPGMVIGKSGSGIEEIRKDLEKMSSEKVQVAVSEVKGGDLSASLVSQDVVRQVEKRLPAKRIINSMLDRIMSAGAKGAKIAISGRLGGVEMARTEKSSRGAVPLHTLNAEIDFARGTAFTKYGTLGIKVWINRGIRVIHGKKENKRETLTDKETFITRPEGIQ